MAINPNPLLNASVDGSGNVVTLYFGDQLDTSTIPSLSQFAVLNGDTAQTITKLQVVNNQVILTLSSTLDLAGTVKVSYTAAADTLQNLDGQDALSFSDVAVTNALSLTGSEEGDFSFVSTLKMDFGAEISAFDAASGRIFVTSPGSGLQVAGLDDALQMTKLGVIDLGSNKVNSVAVSHGIVAVAVEGAVKTDPGTVWFLDADGTIGDASMILGSVTVGSLPDMLTFTADGKKVLVANEGEMASGGTNPDGSVSIIDLSAGVGHATVATASFTAFNSQLDALKEAGVRLFAGEAGFESTTVAQDLEPEYISISPDGETAYVTLQENNAIAVLDIASATFTSIAPLGLKSFSSLPFDGSDKDGIDLQTGQPVYGQYMPDAIASFTGADGETYSVIANEGDDRDDFLASAETARVKNLTLDSTAFPDAATLKTDGAIGRLTVSNAPGNNGDTDGDGDIDQLFAYGARSFSILDANGSIVFDSGSHIEQFVALNGLYTNAGGTGLFDDTRSDNKGPEPEGITIGVVDGKTLAFVTLERGGGGVMVYDVTDPSEVSFVQYLRHAGDESPEGVLFVAAADSPTGHDLLLVSNEVSNTVTIFQENDAPEVSRDIEDVTVEEDGNLDYRVLADAFTDADAGDSLTFTATLADGSALPEWLTFSASYHDKETMLDYFLPNGDPANAAGSGSATDSASAGTAMATGRKTVDGNIAWERTDSAGGEIETIAETLRGDLGYAIGVASTVPFSHATPATFVSHDVNRNNYWDISDEILFNVQPEVVIGGGYNSSYFAKAVKSVGNVDRDLDDNGYNDEYDAFVNDTDGTEYVFVSRATGEDGGDTLAAAAATVDLSAGEKLFGLYGTSGGNFEYYNLSDTPGTVTITRSTGDATPTVDEDPTLAEVTNVSLSVLNQDADGFFIMIEQGDIDWSNHSNYYEDMVGGVYDLEMAVTEAENYVASGEYGINWSNTLVIVTSDHSNSYLRAQEALGEGDLPRQSGKSYPDGEVTYGTGGHTNELVTVSARGAGATYFGELAGDIYAGTEIIDNTQIYTAMMNAATEAGAEHIILFIGDGMNVEHEIAGSRYLYGEDFGLTWHDWGTLSDGWTGYATTWDVTAYNQYAAAAGAASYTEASYDPLIGYDPAQGGQTPYPVAMSFSGTPGSEDVGTLEIRVTATDASGANVSQTFELFVESVETLNENENIVGGTTLNLPAEVTGQVRTLGTGLTTYEQLIHFVDNNGNVEGTLDHAQIETFAAAYPGVEVQSLTLSGGVAGQSVRITGGNGNQVMVIDASDLDEEAVIDLNGVEFAIIIGHGHYSGGAGSNVIIADGASQHIVLGPESDTIRGGAGDDIVGSEGGDDVVYGDSGNDAVFGGEGNDTLYGGAGNDYVHGDAGNDVLHGGTGDDLLAGNSGNDTIYGDEAAASDAAPVDQDTVLFSGDINDYAIGYNPSADTWTIYDKTAGRDGMDTVNGVETFRFNGTDYNTQWLTSHLDDTAPEATILPGDGATNVAIDSNIVVAFNEQVRYDNTVPDAVVLHSDSFGGAHVAATVTLSPDHTTLTIDPTNNLSNGTHYYVTFADGSILDLAGNHYGEHSDYDFSTIDAAVAATGGSSSGIGAGEVLAGAAALGLLAWAIF
ncbi:MAG: hypothetical protein HGB06_05820 [Chlorobaculum sp.]|nr:hypothetical protein [Chlorobaculum sp.]